MLTFIYFPVDNGYENSTSTSYEHRKPESALKLKKVMKIASNLKVSNSKPFTRIAEGISTRKEYNSSYESRDKIVDVNDNTTNSTYTTHEYSASGGNSNEKYDKYKGKDSTVGSTGEVGNPTTTKSKYKYNDDGEGDRSGGNTVAESTSNSGVSTPTTASSGQACRFFRKGNCMFGTKCMHLHNNTNTTNVENKPYNSNYNGERGVAGVGEKDKESRYSKDTTGSSNSTRSSFTSIRSKNSDDLR